MLIHRLEFRVAKIKLEIHVNHVSESYCSVKEPLRKTESIYRKQYIYKVKVANQSFKNILGMRVLSSGNRERDV